MITTNQLSPGMTILVDDRIYRVESAVKVTPAKGSAFIKAKLRDLSYDDLIEKNFKLNQSISDVSLIEKRMEYLYPEGSNYLFLDLGTLDQVLVPSPVISDRVNYLKEGIEIKAIYYGDKIFSVELPQFLELMVVKIEESDLPVHLSNATKIAYLETGAKIDVPLFIESGDVVKVDTQSNEYIQRV